MWYRGDGGNKFHEYHARWLTHFSFYRQLYFQGEARVVNGSDKNWALSCYDDS